MSEIENSTSTQKAKIKAFTAKINTFVGEGVKKLLNLADIQSESRGNDLGEFNTFDPDYLGKKSMMIVGGATISSVALFFLLRNRRRTRYYGGL